MRRQAVIPEEIFANHTSDKELVPRKYKEVPQLNSWNVGKDVSRYGISSNYSYNGI